MQYRQSRLDQRPDTLFSSLILAESRAEPVTGISPKDEITIYAASGAAGFVLLAVLLVCGVLICKRRGTCRYVVTQG